MVKLLKVCGASTREFFSSALDASKSNFKSKPATIDKKKGACFGTLGGASSHNCSSDLYLKLISCPFYLTQKNFQIINMRRC